MPSIQSILKNYWGYNSFRPLQQDIIGTVLNGNDCLALLPTGGGKSICFQIPALAKDGLCLVITPLIALMKDQVENLRKKGITAFSVHSGMSKIEVISTLETAGNSNCKFLYVSPERLETKLFKEHLPSLGINLIAVDEAHCISQWGYDFRPSYLRIASLREELPHVPVLALTASATPDVQKDICDKLLFSSQTIFRQSFERANLSYSVFNTTSAINRITDILTKVAGTAIIYCRSRKKTKEISELLNMQGISADYYHAGLSQDDRNAKQEAWVKDRTRVIVCTNAFGMGIDKPAVRIVIHVDSPDCLENYYQEAGRAGRDGNKAYAVLLVNEKEINNLEKSIDKKFPGPDVIRKIYKDLMNHLQVPSGYGEGNYYELDAQAFIKKFNLDGGTVLSVLKTLEQEEHLYFNEQVFIQAKLQVIAGRNRLFEFEKEHPELEPLLKTLLRTYEGIIDQQVNIYEQKIATALKKPAEEILSQLLELQKFGIVEYTPRKEKPQVYFFHNRVKTDDLNINIDRYKKRKRIFEERIKAIVDYIGSSTSCRSVMIGKYFGDEKLKTCGICDNCIDKKKKNIATEEFEKISSEILHKLSSHSLTLNELTGAIHHVSKEKLMEVMHFLQSEEKIIVNENGIISLINTPFSTSSS